MVRPLLTLCLVFHAMFCFGQKGMRDTGIKVTMMGPVYSFNVPGGDLNGRFGVNSTIGAALWHKTETNWLFGLEYNFIFGGKVNENPLDSISTSQGQLINNEGTYQLYRLFERGHLPLLKVGKVLPVLNPNPNCGLTAKLGAGFMEHRIRYFWEGEDPPQLRGRYAKGYDRYTSGLALSQSLGFLFLDPDNNYNFSVELEVVEGFTKSRRNWEYDKRIEDNARRTDLLYGAKVCWFFPFYKKSSEGYYYE
jgi:hypothetical protein